MSLIIEGITFSGSTERRIWILAKVSELWACVYGAGGASAGSDTANLSVLGYDPVKYYNGRDPPGGVSIGVDLEDTDVSFAVIW